MEEIRGNTLVASRPGQVTGGAEIVPGILSSALYLDGVDGMVHFGTDPVSCMHDPAKCADGMTIAFWLKIHKIPVQGVIIHSVAYVGETGVQIRLYAEFLRFRINTRNQKWTYKVPLLPLLKWHFVTMSFFVDTIAVYVNGCSAAIYSHVDSAMHNQHLVTGNLLMGCEPSWNPMSCSEITLDQIMVWYTQLHAEAIWQVYLQGGQV